MPEPETRLLAKRDLPAVHWLRCHICCLWYTVGRKAHECSLEDVVREALFWGYEHMLLHAISLVEEELRYVNKIRKRSKWKGDPNENLSEASIRLGRYWQRLVKRLWKQK